MVPTTMTGAVKCAYAAATAYPSFGLMHYRARQGECPEVCADMCARGLQGACGVSHRALPGGYRAMASRDHLAADPHPHLLSLYYGGA